MYVARILYPVEVLGPGRRVGIWFCGCPRRCRGCSNPELWEFDEKYRTTPDLVFKLIKMIAKDHAIEGFTITGGDPIYQLDDLKKLITMIRSICDDIIVYTGYMIDEVDGEILSQISMLIDGPYIEELNDNSLIRGSIMLPIVKTVF